MLPQILNFSSVCFVVEEPYLKSLWFLEHA